jgi:two-component system sensor histidine kinase/response regulator
LLVLINDILDLSQVESGKTILELLDLVPSKVAAQALQIVQETANKAKVNLKLDSNIPVKYDHLIADHQRLQQILLNLLSNAIKFTPEGGEVTLRAWSEDEVIVFQIKDNGIGISEEHRPLLFQRFQQLDSSYRRKYGGTGLGLALTKQLVELHQGRIEVESILDKGSSFTVRLPLRTTPIPILKQDILSLSTTPQGRIVLIEDQEEWGIPICDILTTAGYQVVWMVEGLGATQQIQILRPQLIITKLNLDQSEDYKIITRLRQIIPSRELKIMALTSQPIHLSFPNMDDTMIDDYLVKPFEPQQLLTKIINLI